MEEGLASWLEAGFTPPVAYRGSTGHADRHDVAEIVVGALQTTRPDFDGRYPVADFAVLHANLRAGFPAEAALYDDRRQGVAPEPASSVDPRFRDEAGSRSPGSRSRARSARPPSPPPRRTWRRSGR